ncbi:MAG: hypothetical protein OEY49_08035 [Candidatus Heimdallarchaeota archaeon]|nr:hypothetical protein [Candidatus Heimdallarchaeota archaeon]
MGLPQRIFLNLLTATLSLLPIFIIVPSVISEIKLYDMGNYVLLIFNNNWNWGVNFQKILQFIFFTLKLNSVYQGLLLIRTIRFISIFIISFILSDICLEKGNQGKYSITTIILFYSLAHPERFLFYLFRIRFTFALMLFVLAFRLLIHTLVILKNNENKLKLTIYSLIIFVLMIMSILIHEGLIFLVFSVLIGIFIETTKMNDANLVFTYLIIMMLIPLFGLFIFPISIFNYNVDYLPRGYPFLHFYYFNLILALAFLFYLYYKKSFNNILNRDKVWILPLFLITFLLKFPLYLKRYSTYTPLFIIWLLLGIFFSVIRIKSTKISRITYSLILITQSFSILMQYWNFIAENIHVANQLDVIAILFYPILFYHSEIKFEVGIDNSQLIFKLNKYNLRKYFEFAFILFLVGFPYFAFSGGRNTLPNDVVDNEKIQDELAFSFIEKYNELQNNTNWNIFSEEKSIEWKIGLTNGFSMRNRLMSLSTNWVVDNQFTRLLLFNQSDIGRLVPYYPLSELISEVWWLFYVKIDGFQNLDDLLTRYSCIIYPISEYGELIRIG